MKNLFYLLLIFCLAACSKNNTDAGSSYPNYSKVIDRSWKAYEYYSNGVSDPSVVSQEPTFQFRSDGKMYFNQIGPLYRDTLQYEFLNNDNIKMTKPWIDPAVIINLAIDRITDNDFDFTITSNENTDTDRYKTTKQ